MIWRSKIDSNLLKNNKNKKNRLSNSKAREIKDNNKYNLKKQKKYNNNQKIKIYSS